MIRAGEHLQSPEYLLVAYSAAFRGVTLSMALLGRLHSEGVLRWEEGNLVAAVCLSISRVVLRH